MPFKRSFRPHWNSYDAALKACGFAVAVATVVCLLSWKMKYSEAVLSGLPLSVIPGLVGAGLCVLAALVASKHVASGAIRKRGLDVEAGVVRKLEAALRNSTPEWLLDTGKVVPGVGNIDALIRFGSRGFGSGSGAGAAAGAVIEIKSYGLRVQGHDVVRMNGADASKDVRQVLAQLDFVERNIRSGYQAVLWSPTVKSSSARLHGAGSGSVLVVSGSPDFLVRSLKGLCAQSRR